MERYSELSQIPRKPLAGRNSQVNDHLEIRSRCNTTNAQRWADPRIHTFANHIEDTSKPTPQIKPLPPPPSTRKSLANPAAQILRPSSIRSSNQTHASERTQQPISVQVPKSSDRDLLSSQRLRRNENMLPSVWRHQFTKDGLERADSGVAMSVRQEATKEHEAFSKPQHPQRGFIFDVEPEVVSFGSWKVVAKTCDGKDETEEKGNGGNDADVNRPPRTFHDILEGIGKSRRVPAALIEQ
jgi:hypothetical protein